MADPANNPSEEAPSFEARYRNARLRSLVGSRRDDEQAVAGAPPVPAGGQAGFGEFETRGGPDTHDPRDVVSKYNLNDLTKLYGS